jgi:hypothetical protein
LLGVEPISRYGIWENYIFSRKNIDDTIKQAKEKVVFLTETLKLVERGSKQFIWLNASINYMITDILLPSIMWRIIRDAFDNDDRSILLELVSTWTMSRDFQDNRATRDSIPPDKKERLTILRNTLPKNVNWEVIMDRNFNQMVNPLIKEIFKGMWSWVALNHQLWFNQDDWVNTDKGALTDLRIIDTYMVMNIR